MTAAIAQTTPAPQPDTTGTDRLVATAARIAEIHVADPAGMCDGCRATRGLLAWHPCLQAEWAHAVSDRYGNAPASAQPLGEDT